MILRKLILIFTSIITSLLSGSLLQAQTTDPPFLRYMDHPWVDSVMKTLSVEQQIAQCIFIAGYSNRDVSHEVETADIIRKYGIGGIIFFQGNAEKQAELTNYYQKISKVPLVISMDAEWGVGMRLTNVEKFPYQMTLGAIKNDSLIYLTGKAIASQFKRLGMQLNLAPVADININKLNPVINFRSFGEKKENISKKSIMYMKGLQDNGILATAKHFPGHGDTNIDSHLDLPTITHSRHRLDSIELYPFNNLVAEGVGSIMTAHLHLPSLDSTTALPSTLSPLIIKGLLKNELGFKGLVITDAMNMRGVTKYYKVGEAEAKALEAGNDVVEFVTDVEAAIRETKGYLFSGNLTGEEIELKCRKILALKYWSGLNIFQPVKKENIEGDLSPMTTRSLISELYANAITVLNNNRDLIPIKNLQNIKIATVSVNRYQLSSFQKSIEKYHTADHYFLDPSNATDCTYLLNKLSDYDIVIAGIFGLVQRSDLNFGIKPGMIDFVEKLTGAKTTIITWFGNPYGIDNIAALRKTDGLILAYQENEYTEDLSAQLIFGGIGAQGRLPVTINENWQADYGITTSGNMRLRFGLPECVGMSSEKLNYRIDSIVNKGLAANAFPGCVVMAARKGMVVFQKSYGYQTYDKRITLQEDDMFDLASVTKVTATMPALMLLDSEGKFSPDVTLGDYLRDFRHTNKRNLLMRDMLTHQAGLIAWIPFWKETVKKDGKFKRNTLNNNHNEKFSLEVANGLYINKNYRKRIFNEIKKSPLGEKKYLYSDITFIIAPEIIENLAGVNWYDFVKTNIYEKIGADDIVFNPYLKYPLSRIVPTEYDSLFRKQLLHGTVHDEGAAMLGGISGHAGLFSTANDLMKLLDLYRRMGEYGGAQLIKREVIKEYTSVQFPENNNRRGMGFDKPLLNNQEVIQKDAYPARGASQSSFGHSGYTGTFVWIDPEYEISYIFLCNRVYPTRNNNLLSGMNIRSEILQAIYDSIKP